MSFFDKIQAQIKNTQSCLCVGLDTRIDHLIKESPFQSDDSTKVFKYIVETNQRIIEATFDQCACYKPNIAFYEQWGSEGIRALEHTLTLIPSHIPVILDAKRGDIGATSEAYSYAAFEHLKVDAITLSPYMGKESIAPFIQQGKQLFILVRTSNTGSNIIQEASITTHGTQSPLYLEIADIFSSYGDMVGFVVGANCYDALELLRSKYPTTWILAPGIGAQGADISKAVQAGKGRNNLYFIPVVSRMIAQSDTPRTTCEQINTQIRMSMEEDSSAKAHTAEQATRISSRSIADRNDGLTSLQQYIINKLFEYECVQTGTFVLKSGIKSPFYIDLRRVISFPDLFEQVTHAYCECITSLSFDCIAGIPTAALPLAAAVSHASKIPMIYPRIPKKPHGSGNLVEGAFQAHDTVLLLDDLITKGSSKVEALEMLQSVSLVARDLVVLICRSDTAQEEMERLGITLHYVLHISDILSYGLEQEYITPQEYQRIMEFIASS